MRVKSQQILLGFCLAMVAAVSAHAEVRLENTIKKVETYVDATGEVKRRLVEADSVVPGDELQYVVTFINEGAQPVDAGTIVITDAIPQHTEYLAGTAFGSGTEIEFSLDGAAFASPDALFASNDQVADAQDYAAIRWNFAPELQPGASGYVSFNVRLK